MHATMWVKLESIVLSKTSQSPKITYQMVPFIFNVQNGQSYGDRKWVSYGLGIWGRREDWGMMVEKVQDSLWDEVKVLKLVVVMH